MADPDRRRAGRNRPPRRRDGDDPRLRPSVRARRAWRCCSTAARTAAAAAASASRGQPLTISQGEEHFLVPADGAARRRAAAGDAAAAGARRRRSASTRAGRGGGADRGGRAWRGGARAGARARRPDRRDGGFRDALGGAAEHRRARGRADRPGDGRAPVLRESPESRDPLREWATSARSGIRKPDWNRRISTRVSRKWLCTNTNKLKTPSRSASGSSSASRATPATACSSPAAASRTRRRMLGNDLATLPDFPAEIRAPAGTVAGVSAFQIHFAARDILTPGDTPNVLVAMNPAALKANIATLAARRDDHRQRGRLHRPRAPEGRLRDATRSRTARSRRFDVKRVPMTSLVAARRRGRWRASPRRDAQKAKNLFALGLLSWLYDRPTDVTERWIEAKFAAKPHVMEANLAAFRAGWSFGETSELIGTQIHVAPGDRRRARHLPQRQRHAGDRARPVAASVQVRPAAAARRLPDHARLRAAARARAPPEARRAHDPGRGRDRRRLDRARRRVRRRARRDRDVRPGPGPQDGDDRPRGDARAADDRHRRPARRPVDRHADQDRAVGPAAGALRPPRRVAAAGGRAVDARRSASRRSSRPRGSRSPTARR